MFYVFSGAKCFIYFCTLCFLLVKYSYTRSKALDECVNNTPKTPP